MTQPTSTADYRKYPKGPNFNLVVLLSAVVMVAIFIGAWLLLRGEGKKLIPKAFTKHPTSQVEPFATPAHSPVSIAC